MNLDTFHAWLAQNPATALVLLYLATGLVNGLFEYIQLHKSQSNFWKGVDAAFSMFGLDAGVVVAFVRSFFGSPPAPPAGGGGGGRGIFGSEPVPYFGDDHTVTPPPPPTNKKQLSGVYLVHNGKRVWKGAAAVIWLLVAVFSVASFAATGTLVAGCDLLHSAVPALDKVITYVTDFELVLKAIEDIASVFFLAHPDAAQQAQFAKLDRRAHEACDAAVRVADTGKDLDSGDMVAALADMQAAYRDLAEFLTKAGMPVPHPPAAGKMGAGGDGYRAPMVMDLHLEKK